MASIWPSIDFQGAYCAGVAISFCILALVIGLRRDKINDINDGFAAVAVFGALLWPFPLVVGVFAGVLWLVWQLIRGIGWIADQFREAPDASGLSTEK